MLPASRELRACQRRISNDLQCGHKVTALPQSIGALTASVVTQEDPARIDPVSGNMERSPEQP